MRKRSRSGALSLLSLTIVLSSAGAVPQGLDDDVSVTNDDASQHFMTQVAQEQQQQPSVCPRPRCPSEPPAKSCGYVESAEKDQRGCLRYPCGVLTCDEDAGAHKKIAPLGEQPTIRVLGPNPQRISTEQAAFYEDDGATCNDPKEGAISENVSESGDFANFDRPGTYFIKYECTNNEGVEAVPQKRKVTVYGPYRFEPGDYVVRAKIQLGSYSVRTLNAEKRHELAAAISDALEVPWHFVMLQQVDDVPSAIDGQSSNAVDIEVSISTPEKREAQQIGLVIKQPTFPQMLRKEMRMHQLMVGNINFDPANVRTSRVSELAQAEIMWTEFKQVLVIGFAAAGVLLTVTGFVSFRVGKRLGADSVELNTQREQYTAIATSGESSRVITASAERWKPFSGEGAAVDEDGDVGTYNTVDERV